MKQRTLANSIEIVGIGLHKGVPVKMKLEPLDSDMGIVFYRTDAGVTIPLKRSLLLIQKMATVLGKMVLLFLLLNIYYQLFMLMELII